MEASGENITVDAKVKELVNYFTPRGSYGNMKVILTSESVGEILWCDHSNETSSAVLSHGTINL